MWSQQRDKYQQNAHGEERTVGSDLKVAIVLIATLTVLTSYPYLMSALPYAAAKHDIHFHVARIESLAMGLKQGIFPVRLYQMQAYGFGYPCGICYPDFFLYIPAALRTVGLSLKTSLAFFITLVNAATASVALYSFRRLFRSRKTGYICTVLWTLAPYRLCDVFVRTSVGEYLALIFLPLLAWGLWSTYEGDHGYGGGGWICLGIAIAGIVQSHILSVVLCALPAIPFAVICMAFGHAPHKVRSTFAAAALALLLSASYVVPFLSYYTTHSLEVQFHGNIPMVYALEPSQLFATLQPYAGEALPLGSTLEGEMPLGVGWALLAALPAYFLLDWAYMRQHADRLHLWTIRTLLCVMACLLFATTYYFPWGLTGGTGVFAGLITRLSIIQFPWRFIAQIEFLLVLLWGVVCSTSHNGLSLKVMYLALALALVECASASGTFLHQAQRMDDAYLQELWANNPNVGSGEYLPHGLDKTYLDEKQAAMPQVSSDQVSITAFERVNAQSTRLSLTSESSEKQDIQLPLLWHAMWQIQKGEADAASDLSLSNANGYVMLSVPARFAGEVTITFVEPVSWRIAEGITGITLVGIVCLAVRNRMRRRLAPAA